MNRVVRRFAALLAAAGIWLLAGGGFYDRLSGRMTGISKEQRMKNVRVVSAPEAERRVPADAGDAPPEAVMQTMSFVSLPEPTPVYLSPPPAPEGVRETTIEGGLRIRNGTGYWVDAAELLAEGAGLTLPEGEPQILIIHTHGSEAYTQAGLDHYTASDINRTEDTQFNVVRIGDELTDILTEAGLRVIHDRGIYDYPSYTGSYTRAEAAIGQYLESCPGIRVVLDIHRDALGSNGVVYKTMAEEEATVASQIMLLVGTDESGLEHPNWRGNLAFALYLQNAVNSAFPTLMRPVELVPQRYNQQLTPGSIILEVGSSGNTLREALAAIRLFGRAAAPALLNLVEAG